MRLISTSLNLKREVWIVNKESKWFLKTAYYSNIGATKTKHKQTPLRRCVKNRQSMRWPEMP